MSNIKGSKKNNPRALIEDVIKYCSDSSSLTHDQVKECFEAYSKLIDSLITSSTRDSSMTVVLPYIGVFRFKQIKGKKAGSTYLSPEVKKFGDTPKLTRVTIEEDQPDYERVVFKIKPSIQKELREFTENKWLTKKNSFYVIRENTSDFSHGMN